MKKLLTILLLCLVFSCAKKTEGEYLSETFLVTNYPSEYGEPIIPEDNLLTEERVALGRLLFNDPLLSIDTSRSCASCHKTEFAFADDVAISTGIENKLGLRNSPSLLNVAWQPNMFKDGGVPNLDRQAIVPIEDEFELGINMLELVERLQQHPEYPEMALVAYGRVLDAWVINRSLASYQRTLFSHDSPYDQYLAGNLDWSQELKTGEALFIAYCASCHAGVHLTTFGFANNGLYETYSDVGRARITNLPQDEGKFKIPSLRNLPLTAPYMHDGSLEDLESVLAHYSTGGKSHPNKSELVANIELSEEEQAQLLLFLEQLVDEKVVD